MSVPSLESLIAQHVAEPDCLGCSCGASQDMERFELWVDWWPAHVAEVIRDSRVLQSDNPDEAWPTGTVIQDQPAFPCRLLWVPADGAEDHQ